MPTEARLPPPEFSILIAQQATAQPDAPFRAQDFDYGARFALPDGQQAEIWNPAKRKLIAGGPMIGGTVRAVDPRRGKLLSQLSLESRAIQHHLVNLFRD